MFNIAQGIKEIVITAKVIRSNGQIEDLGKIASYKYSKESFITRLIKFLRS